MNKIITLLQSLKIFWDVTLEYWYTILLTILLTLALAALVIWWIKKCQPHKWLARVLIKTIKWLGLRTVILVETIVKKLVGAKTAGSPAKISPVRILIALLVGAIITGVGIALAFGVKFKGVKLSPTDSTIPVIFLGVAVIVMIPLVVIASYLIRWALTKSKATKAKTAKTDGLKLPTLTSPIINGLWAIAGLLFTYWLLSQIWPSFWEKWSGSAGFWWLPLALITGFWLIGKKGGHASAVAILIISIATLAVMITSCNSMRAVRKEKVAAQTKTTTTPKSVTEKRWKLCWSKQPLVKGLAPDMRNGSFPSAIVCYDMFQFKIVGYYDNHGTTETFIMNWDKAAEPDHGSWSQKNPPLKGIWFLKQVNPNLFSGWWQAENDPSQIPMWLEAVD